MKVDVGDVVQERFLVKRPLGQGGMARAFLVEDRLWGTTVALKLLESPDPDMHDALRFEFGTLRSLSHPRLARVHDFLSMDTKEGRLGLYTADYIEGDTLAEHARGGRWFDLRAPICDALEALAILHAVGVCHGDVKPANILVSREGRGVLIDLGCARPIGSSLQADSEGSQTVSGTPGFIAPEVLAGGTPDGRADIFAAGVMLDELFGSLVEPPPEEVRALARRMRSPRVEERPTGVGEVLQLLGVEPATIHPVAGHLGRFVGRSAELRILRQAIDGLLKGEGESPFFHLVGPRGIGRTRMLREVTWLAGSSCRVIEANAAEQAPLARLVAATVGGSPDESPSPLAAFDLIADFLKDSDADPILWAIDDAHLLDEEQTTLLEACSRLIEPGSPLLIVATGLPGLALQGARVVELDPLGDGDLRDWLSPALSERSRGHIMRLSAGRPAMVRAFLQRLVSGTTTEESLSHSKSGDVMSLRGLFDSVSAAAQRALALLTIFEGGLREQDLESFEISREMLEESRDQGLAERSGSLWKSVHPVDGEALLENLDEELLSRLHASVSSWLGERFQAGGGSEIAARQVRHLALAGEIEKAKNLLGEREALYASAPRAWCDAARALAVITDDVEVALATAGLERAAGELRQARERLEALLGQELSISLRARARVELGACLLRLGRTDDAISQLEVARRTAPSADLEAPAANYLARALTSIGRYTEATAVAESGLENCTDPLHKADLLEASGVASSYTKEQGRAEERLSQASSILADGEDSRRLVRAYLSQGVVAHNTGDLVLASDVNGRALDHAERHGLVDQIATAALNLGTARHGRGQWSEALCSYERGLRVATALGQGATEALLRFNLCKLYCDLGALDRALDMASRCDVLSERVGLTVLTAATDSIRSDVATARGDYRGARAFLQRARDGFELQGSDRDLAELAIQLAEVEILADNHDEAERVIDRARTRLRDCEALDVEQRCHLATARLDRARGEGAIPAVEEISREARRLRRTDLEAESQALLADLWGDRQAGALAAKHRRSARELWERGAASLPPALREAFWSLPRHAAVIDDIPPQAGESSSHSGDSRLGRLLEINKRLNSSLDTSRVLRLAMDAAIELTRAERGFLLLRGVRRAGKAEAYERSGELKVAVARNFDREHLERSAMKFSRGIAEGVLESGEPLVTADAQTDERLDTKHSVHAMNLRSVVCVPVGSPTGVLGALYLDNRFQRGLFTVEDRDLLLAFADQVAIALTNAELHDRLRRRNRELEKQRKRVDELLRGQADEIERLTEEVERRKVARDHRFDYGAIVGSSRVMENVFAVLDRVIDTGLPILIQGESGTGKELVARAIHENSPQRASGCTKLVSINCGALPESLLESELFGYERGAFTGAERPREGLIVQAGGGTLFLDEVGEMPTAMQVKLLRVLQEHEVRPLGSSDVVPVEFRLVCATNRTLREEVSQGRFREDLYYRISAVEVTVPPLRARGEDVPELVSHFLARIAEGMDRAEPEVTRGALQKLMDFDWPGNVRQLEHALTRATVMAEGARITARDIELPRGDPAPAVGLSRREFRRAEAKKIAEALVAHRWNVSKVSRALGIPRPTLYRRIERYGLSSKK